MNRTLETLIAPMKRSEFLERYKTNTPVVFHGLQKIISELSELDLLNSLGSLLKIWPSEVQTYLPGIADEANSKNVSTTEAGKLFQEGFGLLFNDPNTISPLINDWVEGIKSDLGLSSLTYSRSLIYAIAKGRGTAPHFDQNINFVLQISGTKKWWIASNEHVENPMTRHTIGIEADPELASYISSPFPATFPKNSTEYTLEPGSLLFVPRGCWHKTEAITDALSLNFTYSAPTWIDLLTSALRARLAQSSEWRATADFVTDDALYLQSIDKFDQLLAELAYDIPNWRAADILNVTEMDKFPPNR
jgi:50S ribosomal protein L16 3-hydroxylase